MRAVHVGLVEVRHGEVKEGVGGLLQAGSGHCVRLLLCFCPAMVLSLQYLGTESILEVLGVEGVCQFGSELLVGVVLGRVGVEVQGEVEIEVVEVHHAEVVVDGLELVRARPRRRTGVVHGRRVRRLRDTE